MGQVLSPRRSIADATGCTLSGGVFVRLVRDGRVRLLSPVVLVFMLSERVYSDVSIANVSRVRFVQTTR